MTKRQSQTGTSPEDRATAYARAVVDGELLAGPHVRAACKRHLQDLEDGAARGLVWSLESAQRAIGYFEDVLCLNGGRFEGKPFEVLPWQAFVLGSLFGWLTTEGLRRFRVAYVETAKGSGKSPLAAGIGLYGLTADGEARAEIYAAATKKDQAMVLFRDAVAMVDQSPALSDRITKSGRGEKVWNLSYPATSSFFKPISADDGQSGPRPHIGLIDEVHEHKNGTVVEMMRAGFKHRLQALLLMITNSGHDKTSVCWGYHEYGAQVASGMKVDDAFFAFICSLDEGDDPIHDESCWPKANPSLIYGIPGLKYLREQVTEARGMPAKESLVKRLNFCIWTEGTSPWISPEIWLACREPKPMPLESLYGRRCWGGLDLSSTTDLTALVLMFEPTDEDPHWRMRPWFWLPGDGLHRREEKDRVPYLVWRDKGYLEALPGRAIDKLAVLRKVCGLAELFDLQELGYDRWRSEDLIMLANQEGLELPAIVPFGQGFKDMGPALDEFERLLLDEKVRHDGNPVLTWCAANAVTASDPTGNRKVAKDRSTGRVDGIVAAVMAAGRAMLGHEPDMGEIKQGFVVID